MSAKRFVARVCVGLFVRRWIAPGILFLTLGTLAGADEEDVITAGGRGDPVARERRRQEGIIADRKLPGSRNLGFEEPASDEQSLPGWRAETVLVALDVEVRREGQRALRLTPGPNSGSRGAGLVYPTISSAGFQGQRVQLSGWIRTEAARGVGLWINAGNPVDIFASDDEGFGAGRQPEFTEEWRQHDVIVDVPLWLDAAEFGEAR